MTAAIIFIVAVVIVIGAIMRGADLLFDHVDKPPRDDTAPPDERDESEAA